MSAALSRIRHRNWLLGGALVALSAALAYAALPQGAANVALKPNSSGDVSPAEVAKGERYAETLSEAFRNVAEDVLPSVVLITNEPRPVKAAARKKPAPEDQGGTESPFGEQSPFGDLFKRHPELRDFFKEFPSNPGMPGGPQFEIPGPQRSGSGSGVIFDKSGLILTNNHVVEGNGKITVRLHDGREFEAAEVRTDPRTDLAVVRIEADNLTAAELGDSEKVKVGDWVLALGEPFGLEGTVTAGIISAKGRGLGITARESFLQTDAAINPGNSGGPLVDLDGKVIGINTAISSRTGGYQGVGFAIPVNLAKWVSRQLIDTGNVRRAYLGVVIQPVTQELAKKFGVEPRSGVLVSDVQANTPGAKAGLKPGDVVVKFNGRPVASPQELQDVVERSKVGEQASMEVIRDGKHLTLEVTPLQQPANFGSGESAPAGSPEKESSKFEKLGIEAETLTPEVAKQLGYEGSEGVVITDVRSGSPADAAGLTSGMLITQANRQTVRNVEDLSKALEKQPLKEGVLMLVRDGNGSRFVIVEAGEE
jgi:serine protease Do